MTGASYSVLNTNGDGHISNTSLLGSYTTSAGEVTTLSHAVSATGSFQLSGAGVRNFWGVDGSEIEGPDAVLNLDVSRGVLNSGMSGAPAGTTINFGDTGGESMNFFFQNVLADAGAPGNANDIFLVEISGNDALTIVPLNASGNPIGDFSLDIAAGDWGDISPPSIRVGGNSLSAATFNLGGVAFDLSDFSGTGSLTGVAGISVVGPAGLDLAVAGVNSTLAQAPVDPTVTIDRNTGFITLHNPNGAAGPIELLGYSITSDTGSLDQAGWKSVADNYDADHPGPDQIDSDDQWTILTEPGTYEDLSEYAFGGDGGQVAAGEDLVLSQAGGAWIQSPVEDVVVELSLPGGVFLQPEVLFVGNGDVPFIRSDLDFDNDIDEQDWQILNNNGPALLTTPSGALRYAQGDLNNDGWNDINDFAIFLQDFENTNGAGSFAAMLAASQAVPESSSWILLTLSIGAVLGGTIGRRQRRLRTTLGLLVVSGVCICNEANALVLPMTGATYDPLNTNDYGGTIAIDAPSPMASFTNSSGTTSSLSHAIAATGRFQLHTSSGTVRNFWGANSTEIDGAAAVLNLDVSTGVLNSGDSAASEDASVDVGGVGGTSMNFFFANVLPDAGAPGDGNDLFLVEIIPNSGTGGDDDLTIVPLDTGGNPISTYSLSISPSDWGEISPPPIRIGGNSLSQNTFKNVGTGFDLSDFTGGVGPLTGVAGIAVTGPGGVDLAVAGVHGDLAAVPVLTATVNIDTGNISLKNDAIAPIEFNSYQLMSNDVATLDPSGWQSLADRVPALDPVDGNDVGTVSGDGLGETWAEGGASSAQVLSEQFLLGSTTLAGGNSLSLGAAYNDLVGGEISLSYYDVVSGSVVQGVVEYVTGGLLGDFNNDGVVGLADYTLWRNNLGAADETAINGNGDGGGITASDYQVWKDNFGQSAGSLSTVASLSVPEPGACCLLGLGIAAVVARRRRWCQVNLSQVACLGLAMLTFAARSEGAVTVDGAYQMGDLPAEQGANSVGDGVPVPPSNGTFDDVSLQRDLSQVSGDPTYALLTQAPLNNGLPAEAGTWGISFDGVGDAVQDPTATHVSPISTVAGAVSMWVYPRSDSNRQVLYYNGVNDVGVAITSSGKWTQLAAGHVNEADIVASEDVVPNAWVHVMQHTYAFGDTGAPTLVAGTGAARDFISVLYVNGKAVSAHLDDHTTTADAPLLVGAESPGSETSFFDGVIGDLDVYSTPSGFDLFSDNPAIRQQINVLSSGSITDGAIPMGDVNVDGTVDQLDEDAFVDGWFSKNRIDGFHGDLLVPDLTTWQNGDLNQDGQVNLRDAYLLHTELLPIGGLDFSRLVAPTTVPEPNALGVLAMGLPLVGAWITSRRSA
ncbi:LamG-like jellyroll fold domain-containing protein [Aeoliella sp.]|uniref:LamG-like jellyroll fold domain-containing protein n=1 Tax=Aeoliella sp. TaxID=2795800 RepID=UPI003CCBE7B2